MMGDNEKFVRKHWEHVRSWVRDLDSYGTDQFNVALFLNAKDAKWCDNPFQGWQEDVGKEDTVWSAAAEFTRSRLEEIRQVEEEMMLLRSMVILLDSEPGDLTAPIYKRTLARLQAALAELKRGMRI
jgi:hypothetical protein